MYFFGLGKGKSMIRFSTVFLIVVCLFVSLPAIGQMVINTNRGSESPLRFGLGIGGMNGNKEFDGNTEFQGRIFMRHYYSDNVQGELGVGIGTISDWFYDATLVPFDYRLIFSPSYYESWYPYLYGGFGFVSYSVSRPDLVPFPKYLSPTYKSDGFSGYIPIGVGAEFEADQSLSIDFNLGYNITFTDDLNGTRTDNPSDAYWTFLISVIFNGSGISHAEYARTYMSVNDDHSRRWNRGMYGSDYDGDGLSDDEEMMRYRTDPYNPDTDGDGLRDSYETLTFHTDPIRTDTDMDGLSDGDEVRTYLTDPLKKDTDGDGLFDYDEVKVTKTNPLDPDTDHGGIKDGIEVAQHTNPLDAADDRILALAQPSMDNVTPKKMARVIDITSEYQLEGIEFNNGSDLLTPTSIGILERAYRALRENPDLTVEIQGHTDNIGGAAYNLDLSQRRAVAVKTWLTSRGVASSRLITKGYGYSRPISSNMSESGKQKNRRIEFVVVR